MHKLFDSIRNIFTTQPRRPGKDFFQKKYASFKRLLAANNRTLEIIADLEHTVYENKPFTFRYIMAQIESLFVEVNNLISDLNELAGGRYTALARTSNTISNRIFSELLRKREFEETNLVLMIEQLSKDNATDVGGKAANLGEVFNRANLPVPTGFAITAFAYQQFMEYNDLTDYIEGKLKKIDINDTQTLITVSHDIQARIIAAQLPSDLKTAIRQATEELAHKFGTHYRLSVRSSATSEDSEASFAGQHSTKLNVSAEHVQSAYKEVVASTFNPRAIFYRRSKGYHDQDVAMSVACIQMIDAKTSGVLYTVDPNDSRHAVMMVSAVWGLAVLAVEGSVATDYYQIDKHTGRIEISQIATKHIMMRCDKNEGLIEEPVAEDLQSAACLDADQIRLLVDYALHLESHYATALDIEWAIDQHNKLFILQARPLQQFRRSSPDTPTEDSSVAPFAGSKEHPVILKGGVTACEGAAAGFAYIIKSDHTLHSIPKGAIVVATQTSPRYVPLMGRIKAFVTDVGSVTGHMASVAREFRIPTLVGTDIATQKIVHGMTVTVDATHKTIYQGEVSDLIKEKKIHNPMIDSPIYHTMRSVLKKIAPLNLTDPQKENFTPNGCQTIHDIIRFVHETAMRTMFCITDNMEPERSVAIPLHAYIPLPILVVDLGNGLTLAPDKKYAEIEDITSIPFRALLRGMKHKEVNWQRDVGISVRGLTSMIAETVFRDPLKEGRMGVPSYAIAAEHYLNFNSRLGFHFTTIDTYCGQAVNDNYITFYFKGGAADIGRRSRRALLIKHILSHLGFKVELKADMVRGEVKKFQSDILEDKLDALGRLLGSVRLLDMVLSEDRQVEWYAKQFIKGNYQFKTDSEPAGQ